MVGVLADVDRALRLGGQVPAHVVAVRPVAAEYRALDETLVRGGRPVALCTIYEGWLEPALQRAAAVGIAIFNDAIQRVARTAGVAVIELRDVCTEAGDYANPIEPSVRGGAKIAAAIRREVLGSG